MTVHERVIGLLKTSGVEYEEVTHEAVRTSQEAAKIRNSDMSMGAKALIFFADEKPILIVVPGNKKVDTNAFKKAFKVRDIRFATPAEVLELVGIEIGAIPPLGKALELKSYFDKAIGEKDKVAFNAGLHTVSVFMKGSDLLEVEKPVIGEFTKDL
jgi:Cys-tRNA(Pro)/Cys-tRNA(Cys) deacylase